MESLIETKSKRIQELTRSAEEAKYVNRELPTSDVFKMPSFSQSYPNQAADEGLTSQVNPLWAFSNDDDLNENQQDEKKQNSVGSEQDQKIDVDPGIDPKEMVSFVSFFQNLHEDKKLRVISCHFVNFGEKLQLIY